MVLRASLATGAAVGALVATGTVLAENPSKEKIARTHAGNTRARGEVLRRADLGKGWSGGFTKPDLSSTLPCKYHPKQSDLVLVGAANTIFDMPTTYEVASEAQVLRTPEMVRKDWKRSVIAPQVLPCLRQGFRRYLGSDGKLISVRRVAFPHLTTYTRAFRFLGKWKDGAGSIEIDTVVMGSGRDEVSLTLTGTGKRASTLRATLRPAELHLARVLARRMRR